MNEPIEDGGQAFPGAVGIGDRGGMSLRDYFAAAALTGLLSDSVSIASLKNVGAKQIVNCETIAGRIAYEYADAMLVAREVGP